MPYGYSIDLLNYGYAGGPVSNTTPYFQFTGSLNEYGLGEVANASAPYGSNGQTAEGAYLDGIATNGPYGGLPQTVWDPYVGRVAPTQTIVLANVNGVAFEQGTAAYLLTQMGNIDNFMSYTLYQQGYVILAGGGIFSFYWSNDDASYGLTGFLQRSNIPIQGGAPPPVPTPPPTAPPSQYNTYAGANALYQAILGRSIDSPSVANAMADPNLAADIAYSQESSTDLWDAFYNILNRVIPASTLSSTEASEASGDLTLQGFKDYLALTNEVQSDINTIYTNVLGALPTIADIQWYAAQLAGGATTMQEILGYVAGSSMAANVISWFWQADMGMPIDPGSLAAWQSYMATGEGTLSNLEQGLSVDGRTVAAINNLWLNATATPVDPGSLAYWQSQIASGAATLLTVQNALSTYGPTVSAIGSVWQADAGVAIDPGNLSYWESQFAGGAGLASLESALSNDPAVIALISATGDDVTGQPLPANTITIEQTVIASGGNQEEITANLEAADITSDTSSFSSQLLGFIIPSANAAPVNSPQKTAFFSAVDAPLTALAAKDEIPSSWLIGLAAFESGWLDAHNTGLNNPLGLTQAGGNNLAFTDVQSAINYFDHLYSSQITGATSPLDFAQRLEGVLNGNKVSGWNTYNSINPSWENQLINVINSIPAREAQWQSGH